MTTLIAYRVPPLMEFRAAKELQRNGYEAVLPAEVITRHPVGRKPVVRNAPLLRGYITADGKPRDAKYVRQPIGPVSRDDLIRVQTTADRQQRRAQGRAHQWRVGHAARVTLTGQAEVPVVVAQVDGQHVTVAWTMLGKQHTRTLHYSRLRPG